MSAAAAVEVVEMLADDEPDVQIECRVSGCFVQLYASAGGGPVRMLAEFRWSRWFGGLVAHQDYPEWSPEVLRPRAEAAWVAARGRLTPRAVGAAESVLIATLGVGAATLVGAHMDAARGALLDVAGLAAITLGLLAAAACWLRPPYSGASNR